MSTDKFTCVSCGKPQSFKAGYYMSSSPLFKGLGRIPTCKKCIEEIYESYLKTYNGDTRKAVYYTCRKLDVVFSDSEYEGAYKEFDKSGKALFGAYMSKINSLGRFNNGSYDFDSSDSIDDKPQNVDTYNKSETNGTELNENAIDFEMTEDDLKIKSDVIRLLGYDPFAGYSKYDQKFLYADLIGYLDEDTLEDGYKLSKIIQLIVNDHQIRKYDYLISTVSSNIDLLMENSDKIKSLTNLKKNVADISDKIAKENAISVKNRGDKKAGRSTLGYLMKDLRELGFEQAEQDYYDMKKAYGMKQTADISNRSILEQLNFDDNDIDDLIKQQRQLITELQEQNDDLLEQLRLLKIELNQYKD